MTFQVLSRVCRPKNFNEVIGQKAIIKSLRNSVKENKIAHAYLLSGTRGVGKTSVARIFSKALRCQNLSSEQLSCGTCDACLELEAGNSINLYEIDGASNNKVENIRDLIIDIQTLPSFGSYKIIIIDEVHMLSMPAFNALLKTLEEPPSHIIFIFATTEPWKIPDTIISRCLRFDFLSLTTSDLKDYIIYLSSKYNFKFENEFVAEKIASLGKGSVRDTLSLLDQIRSFSNDITITDENLSESLGLVKNEEIETIVYSLLDSDMDEFKNLFSKIVIKNINYKNFVVEIISKFYQLLNLESNKNVLNSRLIEKVKSDISLDELYFIYEVLSQDMKWAIDSFDPLQAIEVILQKICLRRELLNSPKKKSKINNLDLKKTEFEEDNPITSTVTTEKIKTEFLNWESFIENLLTLDRPLASKLEHMFVSVFNKTIDNLEVILGYDKKTEVFYNFLNNEDEINKLISYIKDYFKIEFVSFDFVSVTNNSDAKSISQVKEERKIVDIEDRKNDLLNNETIKRAEEIFNSKIEKVKIN